MMTGLPRARTTRAVILGLSLPVAICAQASADQAQSPAGMTAPPPPPALAAGFTHRTFGPAIQVNRNWHRMGFYGLNPQTMSVVQNADGSVRLGGPWTFNAQLSTAKPSRNVHGWEGIAFGGGLYMEATLAWSGTLNRKQGWPAFWANDIETMSKNAPHLWKGKGPGYGNWIEVDVMEYWGPNTYGAALHNWFGRLGSGVKTSTDIPQLTVQADATASPHKYGFMWRPASQDKQGHAAFYFDRNKVPGSDVFWDKYNPDSGAPPQPGTTAFSVIDELHIALLLGTGASSPMTVYSVEVWQETPDRNLKY